MINNIILASEVILAFDEKVKVRGSDDKIALPVRNVDFALLALPADRLDIPSRFNEHIFKSIGAKRVRTVHDNFFNPIIEGIKRVVVVGGERD